MQTIATALLTPGDVILFFSYSGSTRDMQEVLDLQKNAVFPLFLLRIFVNHWLPVMQTFLICYGYNENPLQSGSIAAKIGQMFLIDCLFNAYCQNTDENSAARDATSPGYFTQAVIGYWFGQEAGGTAFIGPGKSGVIPEAAYEAAAFICVLGRWGNGQGEAVCL